MFKVESTVPWWRPFKRRKSLKKAAEIEAHINESKVGHVVTDSIFQIRMYGEAIIEKPKDF